MTDYPSRFYEQERYAGSIETLTGERPVSAVVLMGRTKFTRTQHLVRTPTHLVLVSPSAFGRSARAVVGTLQRSDVTEGEGKDWARLQIRGRNWFVLQGYEPRYARDELRRVLAPEIGDDAPPA